MKPTFDHTVNILVKAYLNNTLKHADCQGCAVGNIVHAAGAPMSAGLLSRGSCGSWKWAFYTDPETQKQDIKPFGDESFEHALEVIRPTGYEWEELAMVEFAFETAPHDIPTDDRMLNSLLAVVDVLATIHNVDLSTKEQAKLLFVK